jgi:hypothetical protein
MQNEILTYHVLLESIGITALLFTASRLVAEGMFWYSVRRVRAEMDLEKSRATAPKP